MTSSLSKNKSVEVVDKFDPWRPVLKNSPSLHTTEEQDVYIKEILDICSSDSAFAKKAYAALKYILSQEEEIPAVFALTSVSPNTAHIDTPITLVATGTGFTAGCTIMFGGNTVTTFVSETELSASVTTPSTPGTIPVTVTDINEAPSNSVDFTVTNPVTLLADKVHKGQEKK